MAVVGGCTSSGAGEGESGGDSISSGNISQRYALYSGRAGLELLRLEHSATFMKDNHSRKSAGGAFMHGFDKGGNRPTLITEGKARILAFAERALKGEDEVRNIVGGAYVVTEDLDRGVFISTWCVLVTDDFHVVIEAPCLLAPPSRDTLISLLDTAEEIGCPGAYVCVDKSFEYFKQFVRAFKYYGFEMMQNDSDGILRSGIVNDFALMASTVTETDSN